MGIDGQQPAAPPPCHDRPPILPPPGAPPLWAVSHKQFLCKGEGGPKRDPQSIHSSAVTSCLIYEHGLNPVSLFGSRWLWSKRSLPKQTLQPGHSRCAHTSKNSSGPPPSRPPPSGPPSGRGRTGPPRGRISLSARTMAMRPWSSRWSSSRPPRRLDRLQRAQERDAVRASPGHHQRVGKHIRYTLPLLYQEKSDDRDVFGRQPNAEDYHMICRETPPYCVTALCKSAARVCVWVVPSHINLYLIHKDANVLQQSVR